VDPVASTACRVARRRVPAGKIADCIQTGDTTGTLQAICPDCIRMIYRRVNPQKLNGVRGDLEITVTRARTRIEETSNPNVNCDSVGGDPQ